MYSTKLLFAFVFATAMSTMAVATPSAPTTRCFEDAMRSGSGGAQVQALLVCAQTGAAVLAVLDAVDRGAVTPSDAGATARKLAADVMSRTHRELGVAFVADAQDPTPDELRKHISDEVAVLGADRRTLPILVLGAWESPGIARTDYRAATQRALAEWTASNGGKK